MPPTPEKINAQIMERAIRAVRCPSPKTASWYEGMVLGLALAYLSAGLIDEPTYEEYWALVAFVGTKK